MGNVWWWSSMVRRHTKESQIPTHTTSLHITSINQTALVFLQSRRIVLFCIFFFFSRFVGTWKFSPILIPWFSIYCQSRVEKKKLICPPRTRRPRCCRSSPEREVWHANKVGLVDRDRPVQKETPTIIHPQVRATDHSSHTEKNAPPFFARALLLEPSYESRFYPNHNAPLDSVRKYNYKSTIRDVTAKRCFVHLRCSSATLFRGWERGTMVKSFDEERKGTEILAWKREGKAP